MAGRIPRPFIDDLLSRIDIVDVIDARVSLKKAGRDHMACCPFHNEKTPSFSVSQVKQFYHCFGCGENGNAIGFLMEYEGLHFVDAIEMLAESVGMEVPRDEQASQRRDDARPLYALLDEVAQYYRRALRDAPEAIDYLKRRGLDGDTAKRYGIGWTPGGRDALSQAFPGRDAELVRTGMLGGDAGRAPYPRFRDRIMFPIRDRRGRTIGFGGRLIAEGEPKYLNSPETPIFHKGSELYGLFEARKAAQDIGRIIVVEGYMDVVALAQAGIDYAVATLGTAANPQHSETLFKTVPDIVFCFDGDRAGRAAAWRALQATLPLLADGRDAHFLFLPDGEDPDSYVKTHGKAGFEDLLVTRVPIVDQLYAHLAAELDTSSIGGKAQLAEKARPLVGQIPRGVYRQLALRRLETLIGLSLGSEAAGAAPAPPRPARPGMASGGSNLTPMSRAVLLILQHPGVVGELEPEAFDYDDTLPGAAILSRLIGYCEADPTMNTARLIERFRDSAGYKSVSQLATRDWWPDGRALEFDVAAVEFAHCIERLSHQGGERHADKVAPQARTGLVGLKRSR